MSITARGYAKATMWFGILATLGGNAGAADYSDPIGVVVSTFPAIALAAPHLWGIGVGWWPADAVLRSLWGTGDLVSFPLFPWLAYGLAGLRRGLVGPTGLVTESEEFGPVRGLDILPGRVARFFPDGAPAGVKIPHMGWNAISKAAPTPVLADVPDGAYVYFVHSYYPVPDDPSVIATTTEHGGLRYASSVTQGNLYACQFHPEKSSAIGLRMLKNFGAMVAGAVAG